MRIIRTIGAGLVAIAVSQRTLAVPTVYDNQAAFDSAVASLQFNTMVHEGFENDDTWGVVRTTVVGGQVTSPSIESRGLTWRSNNSTSEISTAPGAALSGSWGFLSLPHGSYSDPEPGTSCDIPGDCGDGLTIASGNNVMFAAGGWFRTNTPFAKLGVFVGGYSLFGDKCNLEGVDCDAVSIGTSMQFLGIIDEAGFTTVEFRELEGKTEGPFEGDIKLIFSDDFAIAMNIVYQTVPLFPVVASMMLGMMIVVIANVAFIRRS